MKIAADSIAAAIERQIRDDTLQNALQEMKSRDRLLEGTATAANALLTVKNLDEAVQTTLQIIGKSLDIDRVMAIDHFEHPSSPFSVRWRILYEWTSPHAISQFTSPNLAQDSYEGIEEWYELESSGQGISCLLEDLPEPFRSIQAEAGVKALHSVPIFINSVLLGRTWD